MLVEYSDFYFWKDYLFIYKNNLFLIVKNTPDILTSISYMIDKERPKHMLKVCFYKKKYMFYKYHLDYSILI